MRLHINALLVRGKTNERGVEIEIPELRALCLDGVSEVKAIDPETGDRRSFDDEEIRDFEQMLDRFVDLQTAKAMVKYLHRMD